MATTGTINVQTENIFPIIKKFLYSDHEIFLRELISNATDATSKLKSLSSLGEFKGDLGDLKIEIVLDKKKKTLTIKDKGIGMTAAEVDKYINQIAFSGAEEFVKMYKDKTDANLIGHFGLGFYSSFMVAEKVEIITKSFKDESAVVWSCDGSPNYTIENHKRTERGTDIVLHIAEDSKEFLEEARVTTLLNKYCKFMPISIKFGTKEESVYEGEGDDKKEKKTTVDNIINNPEPAWTKAPATLKDEDYKGFYRELYPMTFEEPLFHIHLNVDYPFNLTGILYFPRIKNNFEIQRNKIQLYSNQVFVSDSVEGIVPDFLMLLHGVIDSPDIPLNVSRSYLQADGNVKKISGHITKKVSDKLEDMFKKDREDFEKKWDEIKLFMEYGILSDEKFSEKATKFSLFKTTDSKYFTFDEFTEKIKPIQTDKNKRLVYLYTTNAEEQHSYIIEAKEKGYEVILLDSPLAAHYIQKLESVIKDSSFVRVDADTIDNLIKKDETIPSKLTEKEQEELKPSIEELVPKEQFTVTFESMSEKSLPFTITRSEFMRRMKEQSQVGGGGMFGMGNLPDMFNLVVNSNHPLIGKIKGETDVEKRKQLIKQGVDLAKLSQNMLKGEELTNFVKRSFEIIN